MNPKEVISINIGQAGVQISNAVWELLCLEHGILANGRMPESANDDGTFQTFFHETQSEQFVPRSLLIDLEPSVIDEVRTGVYRNLYHPDQLINDKEDAGNNFARGHFTKGKSIVKKVMDRIRKLTDVCHNFQSFFVSHSYGGGTGSGFTSLLLEKINQEYARRTKFSVSIFPSPMMSTAVVEPYNSILHSHAAMDCTDVSVIMDNEALYDLCSRYLDIHNPTYVVINRLIAQVFSSITASFRFESSVTNDMDTMMTNVIPYPRLHFPVCNYAPILSSERADHTAMSIDEITRELFESYSQTLRCDPTRGKYMACAIQYRGFVNAGIVHETIRELKSHNQMPFVDWCPTGFKIGINTIMPTIVPNSHMAPSDKNATLITNTTSVCEVFQKLIRKFELLFSKRAMVHHFVGEGMEEGEFLEAKEDYNQLIADYIEAALPSESSENNIECNNLNSPERTTTAKSSQNVSPTPDLQQSYSQPKSVNSHTSPPSTHVVVESNKGSYKAATDEYDLDY